MRDGDLLVRWGGEEFLLMLPETDMAGALALAQTLRLLVAGLSCASGPFTVSIGVAQRLPGEEIAATLKRADAAMYAAKNAGRNRCTPAPSPD